MMQRGNRRFWAPTRSWNLIQQNWSFTARTSALSDSVLMKQDQKVQKRYCGRSDFFPPFNIAYNWNASRLAGWVVEGSISFWSTTCIVKSQKNSISLYLLRFITVICSLNIGSPAEPDLSFCVCRLLRLRLIAKAIYCGKASFMVRL